MGRENPTGSAETSDETSRSHEGTVSDPVDAQQPTDGLAAIITHMVHLHLGPQAQVGMTLTGGDRSTVMGRRSSRLDGTTMDGIVVVEQVG